MTPGLPSYHLDSNQRLVGHPNLISVAQAISHEKKGRSVEDSGQQQKVEHEKKQCVQVVCILTCEPILGKDSDP